jgi:hypothetical protein
MAFKMKKPSMIEGTSVHKNAIKLNRDMDRTNADDGRAGSSAFQKKDFGMDESGMKFKKIGSKIREKLAKRKQNVKASDPEMLRKEGESNKEYKARQQERKDVAAREFSEGRRSSKNVTKQDIGQTGVTQGKKTSKKTKEFKTDAEGNVTMSKVKTRGGKVVTKTVDAEGKKTKTVENVRKRKRLQKELDKINEAPMIVEGGKLSKKKAKLEKKIAKTTKDPKVTTRRAAGETVKGKRHTQTVKSKRDRLRKDFYEKSEKPIEEFNKKELEAYNKKLAELKKQDYKVVDREEGKGITMRSPMRADDDDGTTTKTTKLIKKGKTTTETTPGTKTTPKKQKFTGMQDACSPAFIKANGPAACDAFKRRNPPKKTPPKTKTTTTPDKEETLTLKQKKKPTLEFKEGKFTTRTVTDKKKQPKKKRKKISLRGLLPGKKSKIGCPNVDNQNM